jgi:hypothetical protein
VSLQSPFSPCTSPPITAVQTPWMRDYAPRCGFHDPIALADRLIDEFLRRHLVVYQDDLLVNRVAK